MINFNNLILGRHESKVLFMWKAENGTAVLGSFRGIKDGIEAILAREGITCAQRASLEKLRPIAKNSDWNFTALKRRLLRPVKNRLPKNTAAQRVVGAPPKFRMSLKKAKTHTIASPRRRA